MSKNIISGKNKSSEEDSDNRRYDNVLKNVEIENEESVEVPAEKNDNNAHTKKQNNEEIRPIMEQGEIVGVFYKCVCGRETEIRFDYSE